MKKLAFLLLFALLCYGLAFSQSAGSTMYVAVKSAEIKSSTGFFASKTGVLGQGEAVTVVRTNGNWVEIRTRNSQTGWVALSSLSSKRVTSSGSSASAGEIALAGKGFSPGTEMEYRKSGLDYSDVNNMEGINIPIAELQKFVEEGRLAKGE
jgi:uncharacterized protein YgiM (DUF1202 family)